MSISCVGDGPLSSKGLGEETVDEGDGSLKNQQSTDNGQNTSISQQ
jgi:hypothetical protein